MNVLVPPPTDTQAKRSRSAGLDIARCVAIVCVVAGHFFLNTPFKDAIFEGPSMFLQGWVRFLFPGVPLFLIITGYLNLHKTVSRKYYKGLTAVIVSYLAISLVTIAVREAWLDTHLSPVQWLLKITDFSAINYAWYIEMWIGLFLLTPFLNVMWKGIGERRHRKVLLATLYLLCALPDMFNRYGVHLVPGYWEPVYPVAFYFIGAYIRDYQPKVKAWRLVAFILGCGLVNPAFNVLFVHHYSMIQIAGDGNGVVGMPMATALFLLLYRLDVASKGWRRVLEVVSKASLDMYLISYVFDQLYYPWLKQRFFVDQGQFGAWFFVVVPAVLVSSLLFAELKKGVFLLLRLPTK